MYSPRTRIQRKSTFCASSISYQASRPNFSRPRWPFSLLRYMLFAFDRTSWQLNNKRSVSIVYTMHSIQPAEHLHSLIKTKNRCLLRNRGLITEDLTFMTWCRKPNVTNGRHITVDLPKSRGSSRRRILSIRNVACGHQTAARKILSVLSIASWV